MDWETLLSGLRGRPWRLRLDPVASGLENMALDLLLLESAAEPTLRLYGWDCPTVSLGYSQKWAPEGFPCVRRPTGGRALLHDREITYCLVLPDAGPVRVDHAFCGITGTLREALLALGVPVACGTARQGGRSRSCLAMVNRGELVTERGKLVGSAQARRDGRLLQHGSIPLRVDQALWEAAFGDHPAVHGLEDLGVTLTPEQLAASWAETLGVRWA